MLYRSYCRSFIAAACFAAISIPMAQGRDYEGSFERACELHDLKELLDDAETLVFLDRVDAQMNSVHCPEPWQEYTEATSELKQMNARQQSSDSADWMKQGDIDWFNEQADRQDISRDDYLRCYYDTLSQRYRNQLPSGVRSKSTLVEYYEQLIEANAEHELSEENAAQLIEKVKQKIEDIESEPADIGQVYRLEGALQIKHQGRWSRAKQGDKLLVGDEVRTGKNAIAQLVFGDGKPDLFGPTVIDLLPGTTISMSEWIISLEEGRQCGEAESLLIKAAELIEGTFNAISNTWGSGSLFSVKAGTTISGIRGTEFEMSYRPGTDTVVIRLREGVVDVTAPRMPTRILYPGQELTVVDGEAATGDIPL